MIIKDAKVVREGREEILDILIENGKFVDFAKNIEKEGEECIDAKGQYVIPGVIDVHTHMRDPGFPHKEDVESGSRAAIRGGVTTFFDMPNTTPPTTTLEFLEQKRARYAGNSYADYGFYFGGTKFDNHIEVEKAKDQTVATKIFLNVSTGDMLVEEDPILENIFRASKMVAVHAEEEMVEKAIALAEKTGKRLYLCHISLAKELDMIAKAKARALDVFAEVTPHHLYLNDEDREKNEESKRMLRTKPELKTKADNEALWKALAEGILDSVGTDHAPHTVEDKKAKITFGMPSVEHSLEMMWRGVKEGRLSIARLQEVMSENPAKIFGLSKKGKLAVGYDADCVILDDRDESVISKEEILTKSAWSPYIGQKRGAKVLKTILRGKLVYDQGKFVKKIGEEV